MKVFVDTGGFAALYYDNDQRHEPAKKVWGEFGEQNARLFTSNYVVAETINLLRVRAGYQACLRFGGDIFSSKAVKILRISESHEMKAWEIFKKYADQDFSFTDCASFALMQDLRLSAAFAFDQHFRIIGFETLPSREPG